MTRFAIYFCALGGMIFCFLPLGHAYPRPAESLEKWTAPVISKLSERSGLTVGLSVADVRSGKWVVQKNADTPLQPASVMKVLTSYMVLSKLGADFLFQTRVMTTGKQKGDRLKGPVYLVGSGDPLLMSERMWLFANAIARLGIKHFDGPVFVDTSLFEKQKSLEERRIDGAVNRAYNAILNPLSFNFNTTTLVIRPSWDGKKALVSADPPNSYIRVVSKVKVTKGSRVKVRARYVKGTPEGEVYEVTGTVGRQAEEKRLYRNIRYPAHYFAHVLKSMLAQKGITFGGKVKEGKTPRGAKELVSFESLPLPQIVDGLNKYSNNFVADQMVITAAAHLKGKPGSLDVGLQLIRDSLKDLDISPKGMVLANGSGLSKEIRLTPNQVTHVLLHAHKNLSWGPYFVSSLSTSGIDGTLKDRLHQRSYSARMKGKTGSIANVTSLAGYIHTKDGQILAVTSLINDSKRRNLNMRPLQDELFRRLIDWGL